MQLWLIIIIVICASLAAVLLILLLLALLCYNVAFGKRYDKSPLLKYFTADDFSLSAEAVEFKVKKNTVRGFIYRKPDIKSNGCLVIFCHGMGAGHLAYTTEIAYFCNDGYTVLAADSVGCNLSDGKSIGGMYFGALTAIAAYDYAKASPELSDMKICFVGHSWGGYSALCASSARKADKVVAISAPDTPAATIRDGAAPVISRGLACLLYPFWIIIDKIKFGKNGNKSAAKCAQSNNTPTMLVHGGKDTIVSAHRAVYYIAEGGSITKYLDKDKRHNPYNTVAAEDVLAQLSKALASAKKMSEAERKEVFGKLDCYAATEEDKTVMSAMAEFIASD